MRTLAVMIAVTFVAVPTPSAAEQVPIGNNTEDGLRQKCSGGLFIPRDRPNGRPPSPDAPYACYKNGRFVVCGGGTPEQKRTCTISRMAPADRKGIDQRLVRPRKGG